MGLTNLRPNRNDICCHYVYKIRYKSNAEVEHYKARLVTRGYNQKEEIDYNETISPVAKMVTVWFVATLAINNNCTLYQFDVNSAFLYGNLDREVFMALPQSYHNHGDNMVCKLLKSIYGFKQFPRKWNERLFVYLFEFGFVQYVNIYSLFVRAKGEL